MGTATSVGWRQFSTDSTPADERACAFQAEMQRLFAMRLAVRAAGPRPLRACMRAYSGRNLRFAALWFSPHCTLSVPAGEGSDARLLVSVHKEGIAVVAQGGRENRIEPGDIFLIDPARPFSIETSEVRSHSIYMPTSALRALVPQLDQLTSVPIRGDSVAGGIFRAAVDALFNSASSLHDDVADRVSEALPYLLAPALLALMPASQHAPTRLGQLHKRRIFQFVRNHLGDPALDVNAIAQGVNLSPRHLYELFADEPEPLMKWVWSERLDRCRRDLQEPALKNRNVGEIAYSWGFNGVSHFSRSFKLRFGQTPRECRKAQPAATLGARRPTGTGTMAMPKPLS